jgi:hypothetical protein
MQKKDPEKVLWVFHIPQLLRLRTNSPARQNCRGPRQSLNLMGGHFEVDRHDKNLLLCVFYGWL